jgi:uncharacterized protein YgfB (UPF0149 family)
MNDPRHDYDELLRLFTAAHALTDPAEAHGALAGALCAATAYTLDDWVAEVLPEGDVEPTAGDALQALFAHTQGALLGHDMELELLIPGDEQPVDRRTAALCQWCNGFLYGLAGHGAADPRQLPGDAGEVVRDIGEITRADVGTADGEEVNEAALVELVEFVRVGVQLIYEELHTRRRPPRPASTALH